MNHLIGHHLHRRNIELNEIYASMSLRTFAMQIVVIFIPIYLYTLGFTLREIFFYYMLLYIFKAIGEYIAGMLVSKYGAKHIIALSYPIMALNFIFLITLPTSNWPIWLLALTFALPLSLFWLAYHDDLSKAKHKESVGKELGKIQVLVATFGALGPIIGGIIAYEFGMKWVLTLAVFFIVIAMLPLFESSEITKKRPFDMRKFNVKKNMKDMVAYGGLGLENISSIIIWPLFLFFIVENYKKVGFIATTGLLVAIFFSLFIGKVTDKYEKKKVLRTSSIMHSVSASTRVLVASVNMAYLINILSTATHIMLFVPFASEFYLHADKEPRIEYIAGMEMSVDIARALGFCLLFILSFFFGIKETLIIGLLLGAVGALLTMGIASGDKKAVLKEKPQEA